MRRKINIGAALTLGLLLAPGAWLKAQDLQAVISSPTSNQAVRGVIDIEGTCWAASNTFGGGFIRIKPDGGAYSLLVGGLIDRPISNDTLFAGLDTSAYADGTYWIEVQAEDLSANAAVWELPVRIDNTPPHMAKPLIITDALAGAQLCAPEADLAIYGIASEPVSLANWRLINHRHTPYERWNWISGGGDYVRVSGGSAVVVGSRVYAIGGHDGNTVLARVRECDTLRSTQYWDDLHSLNDARAEHTSVVVDDKIFVIGGSGGGGVLNSVEVFDTASPSSGWAYVAPLGQARTWHTSVVVDDKIFVIGGSGGGGVLNSVEVFDTASPSSGWTYVAPLGQARSGHTSVVVDDKIFVIGGFGPNSVEVFDTASPSSGWAYVAPLGQARSRHTSVVVDGKIYVIGGGSGLKSVEMFSTVNPQAGWISIAPLQHDRFDHATVVVNRTIYAVFGYFRQSGSDSGELLRTDLLMPHASGSNVYGSLRVLDHMSTVGLQLQLADEAGNVSDWLTSNIIQKSAILPENMLRPSDNAHLDRSTASVSVSGILADPYRMVDSVVWRNPLIGPDWNHCMIDRNFWTGGIWSQQIPVVGNLSSVEIMCTDVYGHTFGPVELRFRHLSPALGLPIVELTAPAGTLWPDGSPILVKGSAFNPSEALGFSWGVEVAPGDGSGGGWQALVVASTDEVSEGPLASWDFPFTEGLYTFRLTAQNVSGSMVTTRTVLCSKSGPPDYDLDGMSDPAEWAIVIASTNDAIVRVEDVLPDDDFDGDGMSNIAEDIAGTSMIDPGRSFAVGGGFSEHLGAPSIVISWDTTVGRVYTLNSTSNLFDAEAVSDVLGYVQRPGNGQRMSYTNEAPSATQFYRVTVGRPAQ